MIKVDTLRRSIEMVSVASMAGLLSACAVTLNQNHMMERVVTAYPLLNGKTVNVGYKAPAAEQQCIKVSEAANNWAVDQFKGMAEGTGYKVLQNAAVAYVKAHPKQHINYAYLYVPDQFSLVGFDMTVMSKAHVTYYRCVTPPPAHNNPFKD